MLLLNLFSNSLLARLANRLPVAFFDRGHLAHAMPALLDLGLKIYFAGAELVLQDQWQELMLDALATHAARQDQALEAAIENLRRSPTPRELIDRLSAAPHRVPSSLRRGLVACNSDFGIPRCWCYRGNESF